MASLDQQILTTQSQVADTQRKLTELGTRFDQVSRAEAATQPSIDIANATLEVPHDLVHGRLQRVEVATQPLAQVGVLDGLDAQPQRRHGRAQPVGQVGHRLALAGQ